MGARIKKQRKKQPRRIRSTKPSGESRYGRKHKLQRRGIYSTTSPFYNPHFHKGIDPKAI